MRKIAAILIFSVIFIAGCETTPEAKRAIHEGAMTAIETSRNFEMVKDKIKAVKPEDEALVEEWKKLHSDSLKAAAKALSDFNERINKTKKPDALKSKEKEAEKPKKPISFLTPEYE